MALNTLRVKHIYARASMLAQQMKKQYFPFLAGFASGTYVVGSFTSIRSKVVMATGGPKSF